VQDKQALNFRKISVFDAPIFASWRKDSKLGWQVGWALDPKKWKIKDEIDWIKSSLMNKSTQFWSCRVGETLVGRVGIYNIDWEEKSGEVSILIGNPKFREQGIGVEMLKYALEKGYSELALDQIYATIFDDNDGALRFFEKNNFEKSGKVGTMNFLGTARKFAYLDHKK
jgi:RimJ/RimL family protein N-acetyltransferase